MCNNSERRLVVIKNISLQDLMKNADELLMPL